MKPMSSQRCLACKHIYSKHFKFLDRDVIGCVDRVEGDPDYAPVRCDCETFAVPYTEEPVSFLPHHGPGVREFVDARSTQTLTPVVVDPKRPRNRKDGTDDWNGFR